MSDGPEDIWERSRPGRAVDMGLRRRAVAAVVQGGMSTRAAAARFGLSAPSVSRWVKRFRERGHVRPDARGGGRRSQVEAEGERIVRILEARPELSSRALGEALAAEGVRFLRPDPARVPQAPPDGVEPPPRRPPPAEALEGKWRAWSGSACATATSSPIVACRAGHERANRNDLVCPTRGPLKKRGSDFP